MVSLPGAATLRPGQRISLSRRGGFCLYPTACGLRRHSAGLGWRHVSERTSHAAVRRRPHNCLSKEPYYDQEAQTHLLSHRIRSLGGIHGTFTAAYGDCCPAGRCHVEDGASSPTDGSRASMCHGFKPYSGLCGGSVIYAEADNPL